MKTIDVSITSNETEASHRLGNKKKNVIVWVINRKHCFQALQNKKELQSVNENGIGIIML